MQFTKFDQLFFYCFQMTGILSRKRQEGRWTTYWQNDMFFEWPLVLNPALPDYFTGVTGHSFNQVHDHRVVSA